MTEDTFSVGMISGLVGCSLCPLRSARLAMILSITSSVGVCFAWYWLPLVYSDAATVSEYMGWSMIVIPLLSMAAIPCSLACMLVARQICR